MIDQAGAKPRPANQNKGHGTLASKGEHGSTKTILKKLIDANSKHDLFLRIRDMPGDRGNTPATLETKISTNNAGIHPPSTQDKILLGPG